LTVLWILMRDSPFFPSHVGVAFLCVVRTELARTLTALWLSLHCFFCKIFILEFKFFFQKCHKKCHKK
jgi:hypothetical protein